MATKIKENMRGSEDSQTLDLMTDYSDFLKQARRELESLSKELKNPKDVIDFRKSVLEELSREKKERFDNHNYLVGRDWFIKFMSDFESGVMSLLDDRSCLLIKQYRSGYDDHFVEKNRRELDEFSCKNLIFLEKILKSIAGMLRNGLNNDFKNFPEPVKTYLKTERPFVRKVLNNLGLRLKTIKTALSYLKSGRDADNLSTMLGNVFLDFDDLKSDMGHLFYWLKTKEGKSIEGNVVSKSIVSLDNISEQLAAELLYRDGDLILDNLKNIDIKVAKELAKHVGGLSLNGLETINVDVARELSSHSGGLSLNGLETINVDVARELSSSSGWLSLNGLETIDVDVAKELASHLGGTLYLDGLESIDLDVIKELSSHRSGKLSLMGLEDPDEDVVKALVPIKSRILVPDFIMAQISYFESQM